MPPTASPGKDLFDASGKRSLCSWRLDTNRGYTRGRRTAEQAAGGLRGASGTENSRRKGNDGSDAGQGNGDADRDAPEAPRNGRPGRRWTPRAVAQDRRDADPPWPELLGTRTGRPDGRRL